MKHTKEDGTLEMMTNDYTFGGEKIKQISPDETRDYLGGSEYKDGNLEIIHIPNGNDSRHTYI